MIFEVDTTGQFRVIYTDALFNELKEEAKRVFSDFPKTKPATYNGRKTFKQYSISIKIPLTDQVVDTEDLTKEKELSKLEESAKQEFDGIDKALKAFENKIFKSPLEYKISTISFTIGSNPA